MPSPPPLSSAADPLAFTRAGGPLVAVCGVQGGAGTTTLAAVLALAAAAHSPAGAVLLTDADPVGGALAAHLGTASVYALSELAALRAHGRAPDRPPFVQAATGLRLIAPAGAPRTTPATAAGLAAVLADARAAHALTVVDAGQLRDPWAWPVLERAQLVVWAARADSDPGRVSGLLASPLTRPARAARWALALSHLATGRPPRLAELREAAPTAQTVVLVPRLAELAADDPGRALAARHLIDALARP